MAMVSIEISTFAVVMKQEMHYITSCFCLLTMLLAAAEMEAAVPGEGEKRVRSLVVVNAETRVPIRDVVVFTDDHQEIHTPWDGTFALRDGYRRVDFMHPNYQRRYMLAGEVKGDTIGLLPNFYALREVVVYGKMGNKTNQINAHLSKIDAQLMQKVPAGFSPLGFLALAYSKLLAPKGPSKQEMARRRQQNIIDNY